MTTLRTVRLTEPLTYCFAALLLLGPAELSSQSWLTYRGSVDGRFAANCPTPAGGFARKEGMVRFTFNLGGSDANTNLVSEWYPTGSPRASRGGQINASGSASGSGIYLLGGGTIRWEGQFQWTMYGSAWGAGSIIQQAGDTFGCVGAWTAGAAAPPITKKADCAEYNGRISVIDEQISLLSHPILDGTWAQTPWWKLEVLRESMQDLGNTITRLKAAQPSDVVNIAVLEQRRQSTYADIKKVKAEIDKIEALKREIVRLESEAKAAGCAIEGGVGAPKTGVDKAIDELLELDSPKNPPTNPSAETIGVVGVQGDVQVESAGSKVPLRSGTPIPLDKPVTISTGPESSVTIQVGSVRKTLKPNTLIRIVPKSNGQPDFIERGGATVDVRKPGEYQIQTPNATTNVGGTIFTVSHDVTTGATGVMVEEGRVTVRPKNPGLRAVTLAPGEYVEVGRNTMTAVLPAPGAPETRGVTSAGPDTRRNPLGITQSIDLTGLWRDDTGGGAIYRLRQVGNWLYWLVDGTPKGSYVNLSYGQISGNTITGVWVDMPGSPTLSGGKLILRIESNDRLVKVGASGYGAQAWIRVNSTGGNRQ